MCKLNFTFKFFVFCLTCQSHWNLNFLKIKIQSNWLSEDWINEIVCRQTHLQYRQFYYKHYICEATKYNWTHYAVHTYKRGKKFMLYYKTLLLLLRWDMGKDKHRFGGIVRSKGGLRSKGRVNSVIRCKLITAVITCRYLNNRMWNMDVHNKWIK